MRKAVKIIVYANFESDYVTADFEEGIAELLTAELETNPSVEAAHVEFDYEEE